ncbi:MAG: patatin-like phospholipase family protein [Hyphomicrobiaceae bacterium]
MAYGGKFKSGKIGLALGGGAARGWAHIGVLRALEQAGIVPDIIAGTSIGAVVGGCHAADRLDELEGFVRDLTRRKVFGYLDINLAGSGLITGQRVVERLEGHLKGITIDGLARKFVAVATEIGTGHEIWLSRGSLVESMRASYAIPGIFKPVRINDRWLFDGALVNPVPVSVCRALGARYVIAVNLNSDLCGRGTVITDQHDPDAAPVEPQSLTAPNGRAARKLLQRQIFGGSDSSPGISTVMVDAFNIVQDRIARSRLAGDPPDAVINPRLAGIGLFDFHRADELIHRGMMAGLREVDDLKRELDARHVATHRPSAYA